jgi:hypothetical protein
MPHRVCANSRLHANLDTLLVTRCSVGMLRDFSIRGDLVWFVSSFPGDEKPPGQTRKRASQMSNVSHSGYPNLLDSIAECWNIWIYAVALDRGCLRGELVSRGDPWCGFKSLRTVEQQIKRLHSHSSNRSEDGLTGQIDDGHGGVGGVGNVQFGAAWIDDGEKWTPSDCDGVDHGVSACVDDRHRV